MASAASGDDVVTIKKYANRRLYNTESSTYITLEHLAEMVRQKREFRVLDAKSGEDLTHNILTQIIMEEEARGTTMLPVNFLRQLIGMYGDSMQSMVPQYLEASLESFQRNQTQFRDAMAGALSGGPLVDIAKRNIELFKVAAGGAKSEPEPEPEPARGKDEEVAELKRQLAELQSKVDKLAS